jgi:hypothetical protein
VPREHSQTPSPTLMTRRVFIVFLALDSSPVRVCNKPFSPGPFVTRDTLGAGRYDSNRQRRREGKSRMHLPEINCIE